jgi:hypothetical protein
MSDSGGHPLPSLPPRDRPQTVAEAKARLLSHGEQTSAKLDAMAEYVRGEVRRSLKWLPLAAIGAGVFFGRGGGRRRRDDDDAGGMDDSGQPRHSGRRKWQDAAGWAVKFAVPIVMEAVSRMGDRAASRGRRD